MQQVMASWQPHIENVDNSVSLSILQGVSITFTELTLEPDTNCINDSVSLYDGDSDSSPSLGRFCTVAMLTIATSSSSLFVVFQTDQSVNEGRFSLNWTFHSEVVQGWFIKDICLPTAYCKSIQSVISHHILSLTSLCRSQH